MSCAQIGKTDAFILNTIGYFMKYRPAPIMVVQPTVNLGESFSKDRLATMLRTPRPCAASSTTRADTPGTPS